MRSYEAIIAQHRKALGKPSKKKTDYLVTLIKVPLTPTHHPQRMTYIIKLLGVGKFTTHPPWRNNDIFLEKVGFEDIFQQLNYKDISKLFF